MDDVKIVGRKLVFHAIETEHTAYVRTLKLFIIIVVVKNYVLLLLLLNCNISINILLLHKADDVYFVDETDGIHENVAYQLSFCLHIFH